MSDAFTTQSLFERTHERKILYYLHPGYSALCWCGYNTGYRRMAFFAVLAHIRHQRRAMKP